MGGFFLFFTTCFWRCCRLTFLIYADVLGFLLRHAHQRCGEVVDGDSKFRFCSWQRTCLGAVICCVRDSTIDAQTFKYTQALAAQPTQSCIHMLVECRSQEIPPSPITLFGLDAMPTRVASLVLCRHWCWHWCWHAQFRMVSYLIAGDWSSGAHHLWLVGCEREPYEWPRCAAGILYFDRADGSGDVRTGIRVDNL